MTPEDSTTFRYYDAVAHAGAIAHQGGFTANSGHRYRDGFLRWVWLLGFRESSYVAAEREAIQKAAALREREITMAKLQAKRTETSLFGGLT